MTAGLGIAMYVMATIAGMIIKAEQTLISANNVVWEKTVGISGPCLENIATGDLDGGVVAGHTGDIFIGVGALREKNNIERKVTFKVSDICN